MLEQTFFCAISPARCDEYIEQIVALLKSHGKLVSILFNVNFGRQEPPFGSTRDEYQQRFETHFNGEIMETSYNLHPAR